MRRADLRQTLWGGSSQSPVSGIWSPGPGPRKCGHPLKTLTSLNKEGRPFFLSDNSISSYPSVSSLSDYCIGCPEGYFSLAIIAFGAFGCPCPQILLSLRKHGQEESRLLNLRRLGFSRSLAAQIRNTGRGAAETSS